MLGRPERSGTEFADDRRGVPLKVSSIDKN